MMNVSAADLGGVEYNTKTLENSYPTGVSSYPTGVSSYPTGSSNKNSDIKNSINKLGVLSLIGYLLF